MSRLESPVSKEVGEMLDRHGIEWHWRNNVYNGRVKSGAWLITGKKGLSDRQFIHNKRTVYVECKREKGGKQSEDQIKFQKHCEENDQLYILAVSAKQVEDILIKEGVI